MTHSRLLANWHATTGTESAHAVVLADAVILFLAISPATMNAVTQRLGERLVESALSDDGYCFAAILTAFEWETSLDKVAAEVEGLQFTDNRDHACNRLDDFVGMVGWLGEARRAVAVR